MAYHTILFDLDGTLLPMDQDIFVKDYFKRLSMRLAPLGYEPQKLIENIWAGTAAMVKNDGRQTNEEVFWQVMAKSYGAGILDEKPRFEAFYREEFDKVKAVCGFTPKAAGTVRILKEKGFRLALATNPIFPAVATEKRIRWAGLEPENFELYTTYENSSFSKPNPAYYEEVARRLKVSPEDCLMIGNDLDEDMAAQKVGMQVFLLTDCLINKSGRDIGAYPHGGFDALLEWMDLDGRQEKGFLLEKNGREI